MIKSLSSKYKVIDFNKIDAQLAKNGRSIELQKLRCRVNYHALRFTGDPMRCYFPDKKATLASISNDFEVLKFKTSGTQSCDLVRQAHDGKQVKKYLEG